MQCFPLYSILLAAERTSIDFFSLDVEGHELNVFYFMPFFLFIVSLIFNIFFIKILKTIPWKKVNIKVGLKQKNNNS